MTVNIWPAGVGKSLAVGVGTRAETGEMDRDLAEEGMLQLQGAVGVLGIRIGGAAASDCKNDRRNAGLRIKSMSNQRNPEE